MIKTDNIHSLSDFRQNAAAHLERLAKEGGVEVLTVNGKAQAVVMSPKAFDELAEKAQHAEQAIIAAKIREGMDDVAAGRVVEHSAAHAQLAREFGFKNNA